jgi:hypothetical protein
MSDEAGAVSFCDGHRPEAGPVHMTAASVSITRLAEARQQLREVVPLILVLVFASRDLAAAKCASNFRTAAPNPFRIDCGRRKHAIQLIS